MIIIDFSFEIAYDIIQFLKICDKKQKPCKKEDIVKYINKTRNYVLKTIDFLLELSIINEDKNKIISLKTNNQINSDDFTSCKIWFNNQMVNFKPFAEYIYFLSKKFDKSQATKLVKSIYDINIDDSEISKIFDKWIKNIDIKISIEENGLQNIKNLELATTNLIIANKFLKEHFEDYYSQISSEVMLDLQNALCNSKTNPEESINDTGRALEDFLRIDLNSNINLSKCTGISQIANKFNHEGKFPTKLNNIAMGLASIRSMGKAHGVDKKENQRWKIQRETALYNIMLTISLMKSYLKSNQNHLVF